MESQQNSTHGVKETELMVREHQDDEIDLVELFYLLWGHILQIIACVILGGAAAFAYTYFMITPLYTATTKMYVASSTYNSIVDIYDLELGSQLTADYQELLLSRPLLEDAIGALGLEMDADSLASMISIENPEDTRILYITVTCPDPQLAADLANAVAEQAVIYLPRIMECPAPNIYEDALVPFGKASPSYSRNTILGAVLVAVMYCGILVVRYLMNDTFVTPEDINRHFGVQPLAVVPEGDFKGNKSRHGYGYGYGRKKPKKASSVKE